MSVHTRPQDTIAAQSLAPAPAHAVRFNGVARHFGAVRAVDGLDLDIHVGEFFSMLGPSGSGKTTCLRLIAGFEQPDAGEISIFGEPVAGVPPYRRAVNTVFQDYALFPHLNVLDNVTYGLRIRGMGRTEREKLGREALALVKLVGFDVRRPQQLSGGQRQRVALARALVNRPKVLLLDEPLGALDLKLREEMQVELKALQRSLGLTFIFVTHDQGEALSMSDRVAVFNAGRIVQVGTPEEIYERPRMRFVAEFVGGSNVLEPAVTARFGGPSRLVSLRPEAIAVRPAGNASEPGRLHADGTCIEVQYQGAMRRVIADCAGVRLCALVPASEVRSLGPGEPIRLSWSPAAMHEMEDER
ncbi:polyamine ABC transporter ATP-binding protein [Microvirga sp. KLBC 81]|uniref:ABC transporter ATP-binding protein n=1 Tax=Microvirga sp. KLBC 81 TaxID=1862707 RepID=UPI000D5223D0|nr:ABC transporter ATP-binding protein [Microvirga sp. KLBC 81]PVE22891.1 polyamine ABC transporter ATP-binding protein [Microvirga sp. KLBC 81]